MKIYIYPLTECTCRSALCTCLCKASYRFFLSNSRLSAAAAAKEEEEKGGEEGGEEEEEEEEKE